MCRVVREAHQRHEVMVTLSQLEGGIDLVYSNCEATSVSFDLKQK